MEANIQQLMQVIQEMQAEINKLEKENQALRMKLTSSNQAASGSGGESEDERAEAERGRSPATLHGGVPTDSTPALLEHQGNVMVVRRYSISSSVHSFAANDPWKTRNRNPNSGILEAQGTVKSLVCSSIKKQENEEKMLAADSFSSDSSSQTASREHDFGCRDKMKTVSFLLPMDMSPYSKNSSSLKYSPSQTTNQLSLQKRMCEVMKCKKQLILKRQEHQGPVGQQPPLQRTQARCPTRHENSASGQWTGSATDRSDYFCLPSSED